MGCQNCIKDTSIRNGPRFLCDLGIKPLMTLLKISKFLRNNVIAILINSTVRPGDMQIYSFKLVPKALEIYTDIFEFL